MKKIYLLLATTFVAGATFAQLNNHQATILDVKTITKSVGGDKTPTDTVGWTGSSNFLPVFAPGNQIFIMGYLGGGFVFGNNVDSLDWSAQGYSNLSSSPFDIEGVLLVAVGKDNNNSSSSVTVRVHANLAGSALTGDSNCDPDFGNLIDGPGAALATENILLSNVDTSNFFTYVPLTTPITMSAPIFYVSVDATALRATQDTVGFACDAQGEGIGMAFHEVSVLTGTPMWAQTDFLFSCNLDRNIAYFPVIDEGTVGINDKEFYNDMQLSAFPNPANNQATISFRLNKEMSNVNIKMFDLTGKEVLNLNKGTLAAGLYNETVDATNLEAGIYFYSIIANGTRFTKKLTISK